MSVGSLPASLFSSRSTVTGAKNASITTSDAIASGHGRDWTIRLQRLHSDSRGGLPAAARARARRPGRATRAPKRESSAGSTVSEAAIVSSTVNTDAIDNPYRNETPVANIPSRAITTVVPASRIARPEVSIASITDCSTSPRRA